MGWKCKVFVFILMLRRQVDEPAAAAGPTPAAPSKAAPSREAAMEDIDDDLQKALALSMQVRECPSFKGLVVLRTLLFAAHEDAGAA